MAGGLRIRVVGLGAVCAIAASPVIAPPAEADSRRDAIRVLNALPVSPERQSGYERELFRHWSDLDKDGCSTREQVLIDERTTGRVTGCVVEGGRWFSIFDGVETDDASTFDIDHLVPLKEAWDSGAWRWNARSRERFANDLGFPGSLAAVSASSNRSKSDRDPAEWLPERGVCAYAKAWVAVKFRWRLSVDSTEKSELTRILRGCPPKMRVPSIARVVTR